MLLGPNLVLLDLKVGFRERKLRFPLSISGL